MSNSLVSEQVPVYARSYVDAMSRRQYAVDGPKGTFLVTRKGVGERWCVWRSDSLSTASRHVALSDALVSAAGKAGVL